jgi:hypothetical protein
VVTVHEYGAFPPVPATVCEYELPTVPLGRLVVMTASGSARSTVRALVAVCEAASVTWAVNE